MALLRYLVIPLFRGVVIPLFRHIVIPPPFRPHFAIAPPSLKNLKVIALLAQPPEGRGQGYVKLVDAFERVVEGDDGPVA